MDFDLNKSGHMQSLNYADTTKVDKFLVLVRLFPFILKIVHLNQFCAWYKVYLPSSATPFLDFGALDVHCFYKCSSLKGLLCFLCQYNLFLASCGLHIVDRWMSAIFPVLNFYKF